MKSLLANPHITVFGIDVYYYAIIIVSGIAVAIALFAYFLKKKGYDGYDAVDYALWIIPLAILGARLYFFLFPYEGQPSNWGTFWRFRNGGLGIYGAVIVGYTVAYIVAKIKKQNFFQITDLIIPGLLIAQCIGRWGNFVNQEAYGNLVTNPDLQWFPYAVFIDAKNAWYQATFFYESLCTGIGFVITMFMIRSKHYRTGWLGSFYGIYYGTVRLIIESLRSDSLYLWIGTINTGIKISQAVSIFAIILGLYRLCYIYRAELLAKYKSLFKSQYKAKQTAMYVLFALAGVQAALSAVFILLVAVGAVPFVGTGAKMIVASVVMLIAAFMMLCGGIINSEGLKRFCKDCKEEADCQTQEDGTVLCTCKCGKTWTYKEQKWAKEVFKDRQPPERTLENKAKEVSQKDEI